MLLCSPLSPLPAVDLLGLDLDRAVSIERGRISIYPQRRSAAKGSISGLPPAGEGLNQPGLLTFRRMAVRNPNDRRGVEAFRGRLLEASARMNGMFVHYDPEQGVWLMKLDAWL